MAVGSKRFGLLADGSTSGRVSHRRTCFEIEKTVTSKVPSALPLPVLVWRLVGPRRIDATRFAKHVSPWAACLLCTVSLLCLAGCGGDSSANAAADFAPGAFPPTLSGEDYHIKSWTRTDCLTCHEQGVNEAPKMRHVSVPAIAAEAKCRTCHVLIPEQKAPQ
jgi:hypothetical protein